MNFQKYLMLGMVVLISLATFAYANPEGTNVVISEVLFNPIGPENSEYIELYNPTDSEIDIGEWKIYSYSESYPDATIPSGTTIVAKGFYLIGESVEDWNPAWVDADYYEELFITNFHSGIQLRDNGESVVDSVGWGDIAEITTGYYEGIPHASVVEGNGLERVLISTCDSIDSDDNSLDFIDESAMPRNSMEICEPAVCGDGQITWDEVCEPTDLDGKTCQDLGYSNPDVLDCAVDCLSFDSSGCVAVCGDGNLEPGEECDDGNLDDGDGCSAICEAEQTECGDNLKTYDEVCDGTDLDDKTCQDLGYSNPDVLDCAADCLSFDTSGCVAVCGDGNLEPTEECDDSNLDDGDGCSSSCIIEVPECGDNVKNGDDICDGDDLDSKTCQDFDYSNPDGLACLSDCTGFDTSGCVAVCGDGTQEPTEECDDGNLDDGDGCSANCESELFICGDGIKNGNDVCDGDDLDDKTCQDFGYSNPDVLDCSIDCLSFDTSGCVAVCGDGNQESGEECDDGNLDDGDGCSANCETEIIDDLNVNYIRGIMTIDGEIVPQGTSYKVEIISGNNIGEIYEDSIDANVPSFLQGNGYFDTLDQQIFSTSSTFRISSDECEGSYEGQFVNGGNGNFLDLDSLIEFDCVIPPVIEDVYHVPAEPNELDDVEVYADVTDNIGVDSVMIEYSVNSGSVVSLEMTYSTIYSINLGQFEYADVIEYVIKANDSYGNIVESDHFVITIAPADKDGDGYTSDVDCDDSDEFINPGMDDICNGIDDDCDDSTEDGSGEDAPLNSNQIGVCYESVQSCIEGVWIDDYSLIDDYESEEISCDDLDNDCDDEADEGLKTTYYEDFDSDGYGRYCSTQEACEAPEGFVDNDDDCDDWDELVYPGADERCNGLDDDCDTVVDEDLTAPLNSKQYGVCAGSVQLCMGAEGWLDDYSLISDYEEEEVSCDDLDNDCDDEADEGLKTTYYEDFDSDGYGNSEVSVDECTAPAGYVEDNTDCDDNDEFINPGMDDVCNGIDDDCDGATSDGSGEDAPLNSNQIGVCYESVQSCIEGIWIDDYNLIDGYESEEVSCDDLDNDCDDEADEGLKTTYYEDFDSDGYGNVGVSVDECTAPAGYVEDNSDCNDLEEFINPGMDELCNGIDDNCDTNVDGGFEDNDNDQEGCNYDNDPLYCGADCVDLDDDNDGTEDVDDWFPFDDSRSIKGDFNGDSTVDDYDLDLMMLTLRSKLGDDSWDGDIEYFDLVKDGIIDIYDIIALINQFG